MPASYANGAADRAGNVEQGVVVGVRPLGVTAPGTAGTATGSAAAGIVGWRAPVGPLGALNALGGFPLGGLTGATLDRSASDAGAFEYIVRKSAGGLVSVTQRDKTPLVFGEKVLVIIGTQARVAADGSLPPALPVRSAALAMPGVNIGIGQTANADFVARLPAAAPDTARPKPDDPPLP